MKTVYSLLGEKSVPFLNTRIYAEKNHIHLAEEKPPPHAVGVSPGFRVTIHHIRGLNSGSLANATASPDWTITNSP